MADSGELILQVCPAPEDDAGELAEMTGWLRAELLGLDVRGIGLLPGEDVLSGAKGVADADELAEVLGDSDIGASTVTRVVDQDERELRREIDVFLSGISRRLRGAGSSLLCAGGCDSAGRVAATGLGVVRHGRVRLLCGRAEMASPLP